MGGMLTQEFAATWPERVERLVLYGTTPAFGGRDPSFAEAFLKARLGPLEGGRGMAAAAPEMLAGMFPQGADPEAMPKATAAMAAIPEAVYRETVRCLTTFDRRAALPDIKAPTLLIAGELDQAAPLKTMQRMAEAIPGAKIVVIPGAGHMIHLEQPAAFRAALLPSSRSDAHGCPAAGHPHRRPDLRPRRLPPDAAGTRADREGTGVRRPRASPPAPRAGTGTAAFPIDNYRDMHAEGPARICIPGGGGRARRRLPRLLSDAAELGRYCGATALTWNMHVCSTLWTGALTEDLEIDDATRAEHRRRRRCHYDRILRDGAIYSQPFSEGGAAGGRGYRLRHHGAARRGRLPGERPQDLREPRGHANFYGILCTELHGDDKPSRRDTLYLGVPADAPGVAVEGEWDPLGMRGTVSRNLVFKDVFVAEDAALMPPGLYFQAATRWPHMFLTLSPTYMGLAQAAYDFCVRYLRGEQPGTPPVKRRMYPTKQIAVAQMRVMLEATRSLWFQAITEGGPDPSKDQMLRALAAQHTVMENANAIATLAIRTCGGQAMLKSLPLERIYRDSRCGALMLPWTASSASTASARRALREGETD
jgi:alkylation response protein AidB-like acyl-CoA dehydrogenase